MENKFVLKVITPESKFLEKEVYSVTLPTTAGEVTILAGHIPIVSMIRSGDIIYRDDLGEHPLSVIGGFVENNSEGLKIMADFVDDVKHLTEDEIQKAITRANELEKKLHDADDVEFEELESQIERTLAIAKSADNWRKRKYRI